MDCKTFELWLESALEICAGTWMMLTPSLMEVWVALLPLGVAVASAGSFELVIPAIRMVGVMVPWKWWLMAEEVWPDAA